MAERNCRVTFEDVVAAEAALLGIPSSLDLGARRCCRAGRHLLIAMRAAAGRPACFPPLSSPLGCWGSFPQSWLAAWERFPMAVCRQSLVLVSCLPLAAGSRVAGRLLLL